jgi:recombination protein RecA
MSHGTSPILYIEHEAPKEDYLAWKASILAGFCRTKYKKYHHPDGKGFVTEPYDTVKMRSGPHPLYGSLWKRFYYDSRKTFDEHLIDSLSPLGLAIWFMDDGSLAYKGRTKTAEKKQIAAKCWQVTFATHCFSKVENEALCRLLHKKFGLVLTVQKQNSYWYIALSAKSQQLFWSLVAPYIAQVPSMHYKLPPVIFGQYRAEPVREGVETMYQPPVEESQAEDIVRTT